MRISVLGVTGVSGVAGPVPSGGVARRVLAILAADANRAISAERLADLVWSASPPRSGNSLQAHISRWRKVLGADRITFTPGGYTLRVTADELDSLEFERWALDADEHRGRGDLAAAVDSCDRALALWQGPAFAEFATADCVRSRREELELRRERVRMDRLEALSELGAYDTVVPEATRLSAAEPWNEPLHRVLALAHYGRGDQVAALKVLSELRIRLHNDLGLDLSPSLQDLQGRVLRHEPWEAPGARRSATRHEPAPAPELVGRTRELDLLSTLFGRVTDGTGGAIALLSGEPGIGKTTLAEHFAQLIGQTPDVEVIWAQPRDEPELAERIVEAAGRRPVLVVLDDLHRADQAGIELLDQLSRRLDHTRLMLVALYRTLHDDDQLSSVIAAMVRRRGIRTVDLVGLDDSAMGELISRHADSAPDWFIDRLTRSSGGNPHCALETIDALAAQGPISALDIEQPLPLSAGVRDQMRWQLDRMPEGTVRVLQMAALAGLELDTSQLARSLSLDGPGLADALTPALDTRLLIRTESGIRFAHSLGRDAIVTFVEAGEAMRMHRRLGDALARRLGTTAALLRAADHLAAAAPLDSATATRSIALDREIATAALRQGRYVDAERHLRRALLSAEHEGFDEAAADVVAGLHLALAETLQRCGDLEPAMDSYRRAAALAEKAADALTLARSALGHEECSLHARRHRLGARDTSRLLLERALALTRDDDPVRVELLAARGQALAFSGLSDLADEAGRVAVTTARSTGDGELVARTLLRRIPQLDPVTDLPQRIASAGEAAELARTAHAEELALEAWCVLVPDLMRAGRIGECHGVIDQIERLAETYDNHLHRWKVPMWRASLALGAGRHDEATVLTEDFRAAGQRYRYADTVRVHAFQTLLLACDTGRIETAQSILTSVEHDVSFEPWAAARLMVAHASGDEELTRACLVPLTARRFRLSRPYVSIEAFCATLVAEAVAASADRASAALLIDVIEPTVGQNQVLGAGAAMLGDPAHHLGLLVDATGDTVRAMDLFGRAEQHNSAWGLAPAADRSRSCPERPKRAPV